MTRAREIGGGDIGVGLIVPSCIPDATFIAEITALIAAGTEVVGKFVYFVTSGNYTVSSPAADGQPWGKIIAYENDADNTYILTCQIWQYADVEGNYHSATCVQHLPDNGGTIA